MSPSVQRWLAAAALVALAFVTYRGALDVPFLWDDKIAIVENPRLARLWPFGAAGYAVETPEAGRPLVRFTLALNRALGELDLGDGAFARLARVVGLGGGALAVRGYHVFNLGLHAAAGLLFLGLVRRTLARLPRWSAEAGWLAFLAAALWLVHPLQSEAVTYVIQRTELVMACCYLATLYASLRALDGPHARAWGAAAVLASVLGMASKEVMASAPLVVALYDRAFLFASWREAWARRRPLYSALASTWLVLAWLVAAAPRGQSVGFGLGVGAWEYARLQLGVLGHYFRLVFWPRDLCFDYGTVFSLQPVPLFPGGLLLGGALLATAWALFRRPRLGFLSAWVFLLLAPSSSVVPIVSEVGAERRMYLPLAAFTVAAVLLVHTLVLAAARRAGGAGALRPFALRRDLGLVTLPLVALLALATARRLQDYRSGLTIWADAARLRPGNPRARGELGRELLLAGRAEEALAEFTAAMELPGCEQAAFNNAGHALAALGRHAEASEHFRALTAADPANCGAHEGLGVTSMSLAQWPAAVEALQRCRPLGCDSANIENNLGKSLFMLGRTAEAIAAFEQALALEPGHAGAAANLAKVRALSQPPR
jgi:tetratricopeptide (TPR) repeat protein